MNHPPIITLTTDFGDTGSYVGALRGVLLSRCPGVHLADITHHVTPFSPLEASLILSQACPHFPAGTIHLAIVDPGVGGVRKPVLVRSRGFWFVGPDNGLFTPFLDGADGLFRIREGWPDSETSATFHGRDVFAPAAAYLAAGGDVEVIGEPIRQILQLHIPRPRRERNGVVGQILYSDRFGNLITNIHRRDLEGLSGEIGVRVGSYSIPRLARTYDDGAVGESMALFGSSGYLELAVVQGNAGGQLGVGKGERVQIRGAGAP